MPIGMKLPAGGHQLRAVVGLAALPAMAIFPAACSPQTSGTEKGTIDRAEVGQQIKADVRQTVEAFNARDAEAAVRSNAPDFIQMFHGQPNADNQVNLANTRQQMGDPALKLTIEDEQVVVAEAGDMAVYSNRYTYTFTDPSTDATSTEIGNWVLIYRRQSDGTMKIFREVISDLPPD